MTERVGLSSELRTCAVVLVGGIGIAQGPVTVAEVGQVEGIVAVDADVGADERRQPLRVGVEHRIALGA
jgi:hypothetical protein